MKKVALKVALITLLSMIAVGAVVYGAFTLFAPHILGSVCEGLGAGENALYFYEKEYNRNKTTTNLYTILNKSIINSDAERVVKYFEIFYADENYAENVEIINETNHSKTASVLQNVSLSNADNRLKTRYVSALCKLGQFEKAFNFALTDLVEHTPNGDNLNFVFAGLGSFIDATNGTKFDDLAYKKGDYTVSQLVHNYYNDLKISYEGIEKTAENKYLLAIYCDRLITICDFIDIVAKFTTNEDYNDSNLASVAQFRKTLRADLAVYVG